jgi:ABC-type thiamine transport system substrate-binding protein
MVSMKNVLKRNKKRKAPQKRLPNQYYKCIYLSKDSYEQVEAVAKLEEIPKKEALRRLIQYATANYFNNIIEENKQRVIANRLISKNTSKIPASKAIRNLRKLSKLSGKFSRYKLEKFGL